MDVSSGVPHKKTDAFFESNDVTCFTQLDRSGQDEKRMKRLFFFNDNNSLLYQQCYLLG
jgi:hypothetical protein